MELSLLRQFPVRWSCWWVLVPNFAAIVMWPIGGPNMSFPIALTGLAALCLSHFESRTVRAFGIAAILVLNVLMYIARSFDLGIMKMFGSMKYVIELNPSQSPEYAIAGVAFVIALVLTMKYAPKVQRLASWQQRLLAVAAVALLINVDGAVTAGARGSYNVSAPPGTPIDSAMLQNRITPERVSARNLVVIIVEALGVPADPHDQRLFDESWDPARWSSRYEVARGKNAYFGATTNAELREWCGVWSDYNQFDFDKSHCLPEAFREAGFRTVAIHSFVGEMFERRDWYPKLGFERSLFAPELYALGATQCGGVFPGACDTDVPRIIGRELRKSSDRRNLVYWLTLNSHLPVPADEAMETGDCKLSRSDWDERYPMLCREYLLQKRLADAITAEIMRPDFPEADILIVGDHMPPFFQRDSRERFDATRVPWIYLRSKPASKTQDANMAVSETPQRFSEEPQSR